MCILCLYTPLHNLDHYHAIHVDRAGLLTIAGGKWTTYRKMAEDAVDHAATLARLEDRPCVTGDLNIHGYHQHADRFGRLEHYGSDAPAIEVLIQSDPRYAELAHPELPCRRGEAIWAVREEAARTVDDFLARRTRCLLLNARAAMAAAPIVAELMASVLSRDQDWREAQVPDFRAMAAGYVLTCDNQQIAHGRGRRPHRRRTAAIRSRALAPCRSTVVQGAGRDRGSVSHVAREVLSRARPG